MPPKKLMKKCKSFGRKKKNKRTQKLQSIYLNSVRFVFSILITGASYTTASALFLWNDIYPPAESTYYKIQQRISEIIIQMARNSCQKWRAKMKSNSSIAFDGSWSHRRNADHCLVDFIDISSGKIVDFEIISKKGQGKDKFEGPSNAMEVEALKVLVPRWKGDSRVIAYCHDKDSKSRKVIEELGWKIKEMIDTNHAIKSFRRKFQRIKNNSTTKLRGLKSHLERFFNALLRIDLLIEDKISLWLNVSQHLAGDHSKCLKHKECKPWKDIDVGNNRQVLDDFLEKTKDLLLKCDRYHSTQMCESLHAVKVHFANKNIAWKSSWAPRICAAILSVNEKHWAMTLYEQLSLPPLSKEVFHRLNKIEEDKWKWRNERHSEMYKEMVRNIRRMKREKHDKENESSLYKGIQSRPRTKVSKTKRRYIIHKMPKKISNLNPWFKKFGYNGTEDDDDSEEEWIEEILEEEDEYDESLEYTYDANEEGKNSEEEEEEEEDNEENDEECEEMECYLANIEEMMNN